MSYFNSTLFVDLSLEHLNNNLKIQVLLSHTGVVLANQIISLIDSRRISTKVNNIKIRRLSIRDSFFGFLS